MCSAPAFCAWRRLPLICLKLLVVVCVRQYETGLLLLFIAYVTLLLLPLSFFLGVVAPSFSLAGFMFKADQRGSLSLFVVASSAACVHETGLLLPLFAYVAFLLLPLSLFLGVGAPSLSLCGFMF